MQMISDKRPHSFKSGAQHGGWVTLLSSLRYTHSSKVVGSTFQRNTLFLGYDEVEGQRGHHVLRCRWFRFAYTPQQENEF